MADHSPLPWRVDPDLSRIGKGGVCTADNSYEFAINDGYEPAYMRIEDARFIVTACNSHHDLLAALKELLPPLPPVNAQCHNGITSQQNCGHCSRILRAQAAIAKAEGR